MGKRSRELDEINAGSMADIAFLLLIFFLVTTTMDQEEGLYSVLPRKRDENAPPPPVIKQRNVFIVKANYRDELLIENEYADISELRELTKEFMTNPYGSPDMPQMQLVTKEKCTQTIQVLERNLKNPNLTPEGKQLLKGELKDWKKKLLAVEMFGNYNELPKNAIISLQNDMGTSYETYIKVRNELQAAINELKNKKCEEKFGKSYYSLDENNDEDKEILTALKKLYPQKISEATPKNLQK